MRLINRLKAYSHTLQTNIEANLYRRAQEFSALKENTPLQSKIIKGQFTSEGSKNYLKAFPDIQFKTFNHDSSLQVSPIGIGSYKGSFDDADDLKMFNGIVDSAIIGCNMIDSCRNFRKGRSEYIIGLALRHLIQQQKLERNNFFIGSKTGYVFEQLPQGVTLSDVIQDHCVHPTFIQHSLEKSLKSIGVSTLDVYYLNNFSQCQMQTLGKKDFEQKLAKAFEALEKARSDGKIKNYGLSSWQGFRVNESNPAHLSLHSVMRIAQKVGGKQHGMKFIQLPINIMMPEAFADKYIENKSFLDLAQDYSINVVSNSPMLSGSLINIPMPADLLKCNHNGAKHLQLIRSIPSKTLVCTLVGHKLNRHVRKNLQVLFAPQLSQQEWLNVFVPKEEPKHVPA